jgi:uncharacterized membrane protein YqjE
MRSEVRLAKAEVKEASHVIGRRGLRVGVFAGIALLGAISLLASVVIGVGAYLHGMYGLSALIVAVVLIALGGGLGYRELTLAHAERMVLPETMATLAQEKELFQRKARQMAGRRSV